MRKALTAGSLIAWTLACGGGTSTPQAAVSAPSATFGPPPIQVFTYRNTEGNSRVCKGNTATGVAICVSASTRFGATNGPGMPVFEPNTASESWFEYASPFPSSDLGRYAFFTYVTSKGVSRVCVGTLRRARAFVETLRRR